MIANLIGGFVSILIGTSLIAPVANEVNTAAGPCGTAAYATHDSANALCNNGTSEFNTSTTDLYQASGWGSTVLKIVPGFFALSILGIGIAMTYTSLRQAGVV